MTEQEQQIAILEACHDLNAAHDAIMGLPKHGDISRDGFIRELQLVTGSNENWMDACINATAAQRAEAFLRTIGKWKESE